MIVWGERGEEGKRGEQGPNHSFTKLSPAPLQVGLVVDRHIASHMGANLACEKVLKAWATTAWFVSSLLILTPPTLWKQRTQIILQSPHIRVGGHGKWVHANNHHIRDDDRWSWRTEQDRSSRIQVQQIRNTLRWMTMTLTDLLQQETTRVAPWEENKLCTVTVAKRAGSRSRPVVQFLAESKSTQKSLLWLQLIF